MAAPCARMLVSGRVWNSWGMLQGAEKRITALRAPNIKAVHTRSFLRAKAEEKDSSHKISIHVAGAKPINPLKKVAYAWAIGFPSGILLFLYAKSKVDQRRVEQMKIRQRMRDANKGPYESERYRTA